MKMRYGDDKFLLVILCILFIIIYLVTYPQHAFYSDENSYLGLGQQILEGGYSAGVFDRAPVLPFLVSASYALGLDPFQAKFILPLIFGTLFIIVTYLLGKRLCGNGFIPALVVLSFPYFWKWQPFLLVDILLGVFSGLSLLFFYKGIEDREKFLLYSGIFLALAMLTKFSAILLIPIFLFYVLYGRKLEILKSRELLKAVAAFLIIFLAFAGLATLSSGNFGFNLRFMSFESYFRTPTYYFLNFALVPWSLLFLYGAYKAIRERKREGIFALIAFFTVFIFFHLLVWKEMRFLLFVIPLFAVVVVNGLRHIWEYRKRATTILFLLFFVLCFAESMLLLDASSHVTWGTDIMTKEIISLPGNSLIALDSSHIYNKGLSGRVLKLPDNATPDWIEENNLKYLVLSIYGEIKREPRLEYYKPRLSFIDVPFLGGETPKTILTWWPGYEFSSGLYQKINSKYPVFKKIQFNGQDVFIIYEVM